MWKSFSCRNGQIKVDWGEREQKTNMLQLIFKNDQVIVDNWKKTGLGCIEGWFSCYVKMTWVCWQERGLEVHANVSAVMKLVYMLEVSLNLEHCRESHLRGKNMNLFYLCRVCSFWVSKYQSVYFLNCWSGVNAACSVFTLWSWCKVLRSAIWKSKELFWQWIYMFNLVQ